MIKKWLQDNFYKICISIMITTELSIHMTKVRGYKALGGELLVVPLLLITKQLYKELKIYKKQLKSL